MPQLKCEVNLCKDPWLWSQKELWLWAKSEVQAKSVTNAAFKTKRKTEAWISEHVPKQVKSFLCCCSFVHFQGPKHSLPSLSLLASGAGSLSWHSDIRCLCRNTFLSCRKEFTGSLIIARDSTDKYILEMVWSCIFPPFIVVPLHAHA